MEPQIQATSATVRCRIASSSRCRCRSQLTTSLSSLVRKAHAFSTVDGYSLDVFVVDGWPFEEVEQLRSALEEELLKIEEQSWPNHRSLSPLSGCDKAAIQCKHDHVRIPDDGSDVWEIDPLQLNMGVKVASGSYGAL